jgi:hypothetical protein
MKLLHLLLFPLKWLFVAAFCIFTVGFLCGAIITVRRRAKDAGQFGPVPPAPAAAPKPPAE